MWGVKREKLQMVDERMWGDEDKPEPDQKPGEEQRGKDAPAQVQGFPGLARADNLGFLVAHMPVQYRPFVASGILLDLLVSWTEELSQPMSIPGQQ